MKNFIHNLLHWFSDGDAAVLDRYLSQATNVADVERLLRQWENRDRQGLRL